MAKFHCFSAMLLVGKKKKTRDFPKAVDGSSKGSGNGTLQLKLEKLTSPSEKGLKDTPFDVVFPLVMQGTDSTFNVKEVEDNHVVGAEATAADGAYEGGDEHDDVLSMRRDFSDFDLQAKAAGGDSSPVDAKANRSSPDNKSERCEGVTAEMMIQSGHVSDPGIGHTTAFWGSPRLKRSCSNIETRVARRLPLSPSKTCSYDDLQDLAGNVTGEVSHGVQGSPFFMMMTPCSADRVMLKKRSSSQVLPSRSRKLWWKLFLWSHRNLHDPWASKPKRPLLFNDVSNQKGGYSSDTLEPNHAFDMRNKKGKELAKNSTKTDFWPQNQWVAFSAESSALDRVDAWVNSLEDKPIGSIDDDEDNAEPTMSIDFPNSPEIGESSGKNNYLQTGRRLAEEVLQANNIIQSLNSLSSVAHISGMGLKVIPTISAFSSLRAVNLSGNFIVHITPGALPKSLHTLDLSRNKITTIEGLRELTRLRVLNLSYNKISRIGHGLSNCTVIKELYLAGNKISYVEGLHRLLKISVLDLSFNKITTAKALSQLVANYSSLLALNLLGNPIQSTIGDDQLRKAVSGLLPHLAYLNKQPMKPHRAREAATDSIAKAALGNNGWSSRRRSARRVSQGSGSSVQGRVGGQRSSRTGRK